MILMFSCFGVMVFIGVRYWTPYRIERVETGFELMKDMIAKRTQFCSFFNGLTVLWGVTLWLYLTQEGFTFKHSSEWQRWLLLTLLLTNSIQLVSFFVAHIINYQQHSRFKLGFWIITQIIFFLIVPLSIMIMTLTTKEFQSF